MALGKAGMRMDVAHPEVDEGGVLADLGSHLLHLIRVKRGREHHDLLTTHTLRQ